MLSIHEKIQHHTASIYNQHREKAKAFFGNTNISGTTCFFLQIRVSDWSQYVQIKKYLPSGGIPFFPNYIFLINLTDNKIAMVLFLHEQNWISLCRMATCFFWHTVQLMTYLTERFFKIWSDCSNRSLGTYWKLPWVTYMPFCCPYYSVFKVISNTIPEMTQLLLKSVFNPETLT